MQISDLTRKTNMMSMASPHNVRLRMGRSERCPISFDVWALMLLLIYIFVYAKALIEQKTNTYTFCVVQEKGRGAKLLRHKRLSFALFRLLIDERWEMSTKLNG